MTLVSAGKNDWELKTPQQVLPLTPIPMRISNNRKWTEKRPFHTAKDKIITYLHTKKTGLLPLPEKAHTKTVW